MAPILTRDTLTALGDDSRGAVVLTGSHGGVFTARFALHAGALAVILNDAGIGMDRAGIAGLAWLEDHGMAAATASHDSARIGDANDLRAHGVVSHVNGLAEAAGCRPGMPVKDAAAALAASAPAPSSTAGAFDEGYSGREKLPNGGHRPAWLLDSAALANESDSRSILISGSHGGLLGGKQDDGVLYMDVFAALFNDAGGGKDNSGYARLAPLDRRGIASATVSNYTARIGDARSTYETGVISRVNGVGRRLGLEEGLSAREAVARLLGLA